MNEDDWLLELQMLALKYSHMDVNLDLTMMTLAELWGLYCLLVRIGEVQGMP